MHHLRNHGYLTLKGQNLACWCALGKPCHADILLHLANKADGDRFVDIDALMRVYGFTFVQGKPIRADLP